MVNVLQTLETRKYWLLVLLVIGITLLAALPILTYPMWRDNGIYATIARQLNAGKTLYVDVWDIKPPPIYYIYALGISIFGTGASALRAMDFVFAPLTALTLAWIGCHVANRRVGLLAALLFGVFYLSDGFQVLTQSDSFTTLPMAVAVMAVFKVDLSESGDRPALGWSLLAGALCGLILWFKHYYAFFLIALVLYHLYQRRGVVIKEALTFSGGGLLIGGGLLLYFWSLGMLQEMLLVAQGTSQYTAISADFAGFLTVLLKDYLPFRIEQWHLLLFLSLLWLIVGRWGEARQRGWWLVILWLLAGLGFMLIQQKGFDTHWMPMLAPLALMAADTTDRILGKVVQTVELSTRQQIALYSVVMLGFVLILANVTWGRAIPYLSGEETQLEYYSRFQGNDLKPAESLEVVNYLQERLPSGASLYIWGERSEVYYMGGWQPASRFIDHFPLVPEWYPEAWKQENVDTLWQTMPPYALVLQADYFPWVTGREEDSHQLLQEYSELNNWLMYNYERETQIGNFFIWRRKP